MDSGTLLSEAKRNGATVTVYLLAQMFLAGRHATEEQVGDMSIQVPVNMRKFYPSKTVRNFAMYCGIRLPISSITSLEDIVPEISQQLTQKASKQAMSSMMNATQIMINALRYIPLFIKAPVANMAYGFLGDKIFTSTLSNLGVVDMPSELAASIESMDFVLGPAKTNRASCALVTYGGITTLTVSKTTADPSFEEKLFELLKKDGIPITIEGSEAYES